LGKTIGYIVSIIQFATGRTIEQVADGIHYSGYLRQIKKKEDPELYGILLERYRADIEKKVKALYEEFIISSGQPDQSLQIGAVIPGTTRQEFFVQDKSGRKREADRLEAKKGIQKVNAALGKGSSSGKGSRGKQR
jgi:hypothetical protein